MNYYADIYNIINTHIFGGSLAAGTAEHFAVTLVSLLACLFVVGLPFFIVIKVCKMLIGG